MGFDARTIYLYLPQLRIPTMLKFGRLPKSKRLLSIGKMLSLGESKTASVLHEKLLIIPLPEYAKNKTFFELGLV